MIGTSRVFFLPLQIRLGKITCVLVMFSDFKFKTSLIRAAVHRATLNTARMAGLHAATTASAWLRSSTNAWPCPWLLGISNNEYTKGYNEQNPILPFGRAPTKSHERALSSLSCVLCPVSKTFNDQ